MLLVLTACRQVVEEPASAEQSPEKTQTEAEAPKAQTELLDFAFEVASQLPVKPHLHTRSESQNSVVTTALDLGRVDLAEKYVPQLKNWRRGTAHADIALYYARHGDMDKAREHLHMADQVYKAITDWHTERVAAHMARCHAYMNEDERAEQLSDEKAVDIDRVAPAAVETAAEEEYAAMLAKAVADLESEDFNAIRRGLALAVALYDRFYTSERRRAEVAEIVRDSMQLLAPSLQINSLCHMARHALDHEDSATASALLADARQRYANATWKPRFGIPWLARIAGLAFEANDAELGKAVLEQANSIYDEARESIVNIYRAETLAPIAEAYQQAGYPEKARAVYLRALEECLVNPNSRPRAVDLTLLSRSMARHDVEPTPELWTALRDTRAQLGDPW